MKKLRLFLIASLMTIATSTNAMAAWNYSENYKGWWWNNEDGTWPANTWQWIDDNLKGTAYCYYFNADGICMLGATTPDGYTVNDEGRWVVEGNIQTKTEKKEEEPQSFTYNAIYPYVDENYNNVDPTAYMRVADNYDGTYMFRLINITKHTAFITGETGPNGGVVFKTTDETPMTFEYVEIDDKYCGFINETGMKFMKLK